MALTTVDQGLLGTYAQYTGFKNRIINGAMVIDQRNAGASIAFANGQYLLDRWYGLQTSATGKVTAVQSTTAPTGFYNSMLFTSQSAYSVLAGDIYGFAQKIEAFNTSDLMFGTANAQAVTLSFWVRSSLTGTFGGALQNGAQNYSYPFTYTISAANTWEQKSLTVPGPTAGTWISGTNGSGLVVAFGLGVGSTNSGSAGAWTGTGYYSATGATSVVGTNGATFYITGVQLEAGSTATSFDRRDYGRELMMCQRYYEKSYNQSVAPGTAGTGSSFRTSIQATSQYAAINGIFAVPKRANPTTQSYNPSSGTAGQMIADATTITSVSITSTELGLVIFCNNQNTSVNQFLSAQWTASAEL